MTITATKMCSKCSKYKSTDNFAKNISTKSGLQYYCKPCQNSYKSGRGSQRASQLLIKYGMTVEQWDILFESQNGVCGICRAKEILCVDHNHETGKIRGLLCGQCNSGIGMLKDDESILLRAIAYLR